MTATRYLNLVGYFILIVGTLGFFVLGPTARASIFSNNLFYNVTESWVWLIGGLVVIGLRYVLPSNWQKWLVLLLGAVFSFVGTYSLFSQDLFGMALQSPIDSIIYLVLGAAAFLVVLLTRPEKPKKVGL